MKDSIGICLIGAGRAGMIHARNFAASVPGAHMAAVADVAEENVRAAAKELGCDWYTDIAQVFTNPAVDAVVVATPTKYHCGIVLQAAAAGKHILCEKPMAMDAAECRAMMKATRDGGVKLQLGFMRRFDENFRRAKEIAGSGEIGEVVSVKSLTRGPSTPREWMYDITKSGGPLAEVNSHDMDTLRWLTGSEALSVYAIGGNFRCDAARERYPDFYDTVLMNVRMVSGAIGNIDGAQGVEYGYDARVDILGTKGCIQVGDLRGKSTMVCSKRGGMVSDSVQSWMTLFSAAYLEEDRDFVRCIREDRTPAIGGKDGLMAVKMVQAGNESLRTGQVISLEQEDAAC